MTQIGEFSKTNDGFQGRLRTLGIEADLTLVAAEPVESGNGPDYRIHLGADAEGPEVGAGWRKVGERAGEYVAVQIDCPTFIQPIRANLFQSTQQWPRDHVLVWTRQTRRDDRG
jgi:uncharacterized protein (DUF736 family)